MIFDEKHWLKRSKTEKKVCELKSGIVFSKEKTISIVVINLKTNIIWELIEILNSSPKQRLGDD